MTTEQGKGPIETTIEQVHLELESLENRIIQAISDNLRQRVERTWTKSDDDIFGTHTAYVTFSWPHHFHIRPANLWIKHLWPKVEKAEEELGEPIHKGAPFFNTGLCYFLSGDFISAAQFFDAAGDEDERRNPGSARTLVKGGGLANQLLQPIYHWTQVNSGLDYRSATKANIDESEMQNLINFLSRRTADAVLFISAMQRIALSKPKPNVYALRLHKIRALSDLILVLESNLREWQPNNLGDFRRRACEILRPNPRAFQLFNQIDGNYGNTTPRHNWENPQDINNFISAQIRAFDQALTPAEKSAIALYTIYRLRNSLMHTNEDRLDMFTDHNQLLRLVNFAVITIKLSNYSYSNQIHTI